jgi:hypothetical protein
MLGEGECSPEDARKIIALLDDHGTLLRHEYDFNVYLLTLDFETGLVRLDDDLDPTPKGTLTLSMVELRDLLTDHVSGSGGS